MTDVMNFKLSASLTFKSVISIRAAFYKALLEGPGNQICLDLSDVAYCDSAGLALLIEVRKLCRQNNKIFKVIGISPETQSLAEFCGVKSIIETA